MLAHSKALGGAGGNAHVTSRTYEVHRWARARKARGHGGTWRAQTKPSGPSRARRRTSEGGRENRRHAIGIVVVVVVYVLCVNVGARHVWVCVLVCVLEARAHTIWVKFKSSCGMCTRASHKQTRSETNFNVLLRSSTGCAANVWFCLVRDSSHFWFRVCGCRKTLIEWCVWAIKTVEPLRMWSKGQQTGVTNLGAHLGFILKRFFMD